MAVAAHDEAVNSSTPKGGRWTAAGLLACALCIELGLFAILRLARPASHVPEFISYYLLVAIAYVTACWLVANSGALRTSRSAIWWIWGAALVFRLTVLPLAPSLSEDTARYRWQGVSQAAGANPYTAVPEDPRFSELRDVTWPRVTGKAQPSVYGPVIELVNLHYFRLIRRFGMDPWTEVWMYKLLFALADLAVALALMALLGGLGRSAALVLVYLWSPLSITEFWIEGHNDALPVAFAVAALALVFRGRRVAAVVAVSLGALCKFWPALLLPFVALARDGGRWRVEWRGLLASVPVAALACWPYRDGVGGLMRILEGFIGSWRNNDSLFGGILQVSGHDMGLATGIATVLAVLAVIRIRLLHLPPVGAELAAICAVLFLSANCLPWYLTWMLPFLAVHPNAPLLLWTALVSLAYHVVPLYEAAGIWQYDRGVVGLEYAPVLAWLGCQGASRIRRRMAAAPSNQEDGAVDSDQSGFKRMGRD